MPVFCDIDSNRLTIDPSQIEALITSRPSAISATHVYGIPCDVEAIERIARELNLKVIYDAAHAFGTRYKGRSLLAYGDISTLSTHATKLFHTVLGGAIVTKGPEILKHCALLRNFGHDGFDRFSACGINGKNSKFHAAMGVVNLKYVADIIAKRKSDSEAYDRLFRGTDTWCPFVPEDTDYNYSYYPLVFASVEKALAVLQILADNKHFCATLLLSVAFALALRQ